MPVQEFDNFYEDYNDNVFDNNNLHENDYDEIEKAEKLKLEEERRLFEEELLYDNDNGNGYYHKYPLVQKQNTDTKSDDLDGKTGGLFSRFFKKVWGYIKKLGVSVANFAAVVVFGRKAIEFENNTPKEQPEVKENTVKDVKEKCEIETPEAMIMAKMKEESKNAPYLGHKPNNIGLESFINATIVDNYTYSVSNERLSKEDYVSGKQPNIIITLKNKTDKKNVGEIHINPETFSIVKNTCAITDKTFDIDNVKNAYLAYQYTNQNQNLIIGKIDANTVKTNKEIVLPCVMDVYKKLDFAKNTLKKEGLDKVTFEYKNQEFSVTPGEKASDGKFNFCVVDVENRQYLFSEMDLGIDTTGNYVFKNDILETIDAINNSAEKQILNSIGNFEINVNKDISTAFSQYLEQFKENLDELSQDIKISSNNDILSVDINEFDNTKSQIKIDLKTNTLIDAQESFKNNLFLDLYKQMLDEFGRGLQEQSVISELTECIDSYPDANPNKIIFNHKDTTAYIGKINEQYYISVYDKNNLEILPTSKLGSSQLDNKKIEQIAKTINNIVSNKQYEELKNKIEFCVDKIIEEKANQYNQISTDNDLENARPLVENENKTIDEIIEDTIEIEEEVENGENPEQALYDESAEFVDNLDLDDI